MTLALKIKSNGRWGRNFGPEFFCAERVIAAIKYKILLPYKCSVLTVAHGERKNAQIMGRTAGRSRRSCTKRLVRPLFFQPSLMSCRA